MAPKPLALSDAEAAAVPIGALTAWQGLFAVQFARWRGAAGEPAELERVKQKFFIVEPRREQLSETGKLIDRGRRPRHMMGRLSEAGAGRWFVRVGY